jgi:hypothetical protein
MKSSSTARVLTIHYLSQIIRMPHILHETRTLLSLRKRLDFREVSKHHFFGLLYKLDHKYNDRVYNSIDSRLLTTYL